MLNGPGKYDDLCTEVREKAKALGAIVVVLGGDKGNGFSVQADFKTIATLPELLEVMAAEIRAEQRRATQ